MSGIVLTVPYRNNHLSQCEVPEKINPTRAGTCSPSQPHQVESHDWTKTCGIISMWDDRLTVLFFWQKGEHILFPGVSPKLVQQYEDAWGALPDLASLSQSHGQHNCLRKHT